MRLDNKRGVSGVVTAVLLILLVIAAIGILWVVVQQFVQSGGDSVTGKSDCLTTSFDVISADNVAGSITIRRTGGSAVLGEIRVSDGVSSNVALNPNINVGESTTASGFAIPLVANVDVSVAFDLADGTACDLIDLGSIISS